MGKLSKREQVLKEYPQASCLWSGLYGHYEIRLDEGCTAIACASTEREAWKKAHGILTWHKADPSRLTGLDSFYYPRKSCTKEERLAELEARYGTRKQSKTI